jgi:protein translocase SecG subunit
MITFLLVVHILLALALIGVILVQRSEGGALGMGGGGGGGFMTARGSANLLTRTTAIIATLFICTPSRARFSTRRPPRPRLNRPSRPFRCPSKQTAVAVSGWPSRPAA